MFKKVFLIILCFCVLSCCFFIQSSAAGNYTEFYEYSGQAVSSANADVLSGIAINYMQTFPDIYKHWFAFRVGEYRYAIVLFPELESFSLNASTNKATVSEGIVVFYNVRLNSYQNGNYNTYYQAGVESSVGTAPTTIQFTRNYIIGNIPGCINVHPEYESVLYFEYIKYILYSIVVFLLLFVAFKFLNKRWLLP